MAKDEFEGKEIKAFLGEGTIFKGVIKFSGTVRLDGHVEGEIITKDTLIVGEKAHIIAEISVGSIIAIGKIEGNVTASKKIEIRAKSEVIGNIKAPLLFIEEGATFQGECKMLSKGNDKIIQIGKDESLKVEAGAKKTAAVIEY
jgi:cytoskeletal protein CcmA (bactofilin family)